MKRKPRRRTRGGRIQPCCAPIITACCEVLESRTLLAFTPIGPEFRVNTYTKNAQEQPTIASDADGNFVIAWQSDGQDGSGVGIYAQRYNAEGVPQGGEFRVNTSTTTHQQRPAIAMDSDGDFVVAWEDSFRADGMKGIYAQRYNAAGESEGAEFRVNTDTSQAYWRPDIAMDGDGDFVVTWMSYRQDGSGWGIYAQRYNAEGVPQGAEFRVNTYTTDSQTYPDIAMDADGDFVIGWASKGQNGGRYAIYAQRYNAAGEPQGSEFRVSTQDILNLTNPPLAIAMDADGNFVIAWYGSMTANDWDGIYAQRYNAAGQPQGSIFRVNTYTPDPQQYPSIAMDLDGNFVIAWTSALQDGSKEGVYAQRFNAAAEPQGGEFRVNTETYRPQMHPSMAMSHDGDFVIAWQSGEWEAYGQDGSSYGVFAQRYIERDSIVGRVWHDSNADTIRNPGETGMAGLEVKLFSESGDLFFSATTNAAGDYRCDTIPPGNYYLEFILPPAMLLTVQDQGTDDTRDSDVDPATGRTPLFSVQPSQRRLTLDAGLINDSGSISGTVYSDLDRDGIQDPDDPPLPGATLFADANDSGALDAGEPSFLTLADGRYKLSNLPPGTYRVGILLPDLYKLTSTNSGMPITLRLGQNHLGLDFAAQQIILPILQPTPQGDEFRVNTTAAESQAYPAMTMDADGDFVIAWTGTGASGFGIYAQRYSAAGVPQGGEFRVNSSTGGGARENPAVAMDTDGDFIIAWQASNGSTLDIYARRFDAVGVAQGNEFRVNTYTANFQESPAIAANAAGDFAIVWQSFGQDGSYHGIYAQRYNAAGVKQGAEFRVNTYTVLSQRYPAIGMDADGDFVVTWQSTQDGSSDGIYAQRYNAVGEPQGAEFRVNTVTSNEQLYPAVAMDADGDFVIAWQSRDLLVSGWAIYAHRYNASGEPQGAEFRVSDITNYSININWRDPSHTIAMDAQGNFVVTWQYGPSSSSTDIYARQYDAAGQPQGSEFRVNSYLTDRQEKPIVAMDADGDLVIAWQSYGQDGSKYGVYAQRYQRPFPSRPLTGTTLPDTIRLTHSGSNLLVSIDGVSPTPVYTHPFDPFIPLTLSALSGDDRLILDFSTGSPIPSAGLTFTGGDGSDSILFTTSTTYDSFTTPLDLADNTLLVQNSTLPQVESWLKLNRLTSSSATPYTTLAPFPQPDGSILVKLVYHGDMNADGVVNALDYFTIDSNYLSQTPGTPIHFIEGDLNFDGVINAIDYFMIDSAFLGQGGQLAVGATFASASARYPEAKEARKTRNSAKRDSLFSRKKLRRHHRNTLSQPA